MKENSTAYILWLFGLHRFYLGKPKTAILQWFTLGGLGIWWLVDLVTIPKMVEEFNKKKDEQNRTT